jgi:glycosyltransferase involved in cell wall biosynthesis
VSTPLVSVIVPAYNYGRFLPDALGSITRQTLPDFELIVVDDGSTDDTPEVLARWRDARLVTVRQANAGIMATREVGLRLARGKYVAWLDADDLWRPTYLERQLGVLESEPEVGFCFTNFVRSQDGTLLPETQFDHATSLRKLPGRPVKADTQARVLTRDTFAALTPFRDMPCWLQASVFRREALDGLRMRRDVQAGEDLYIMLQVYTRARAALIDAALVEVRRHGGNSYSSHDQIRTGILRVVHLALEDLSLTEAQAETLRRRIGSEYLSRGWRHFWAHQPLDAARYYSQALAWPGTRLGALSHLALMPILPLLPRRKPPF